MELGERLRQARLEAGLSQRQLCGTQITRNMLSLIENGSARPSMDTLRYLADRLEKPLGFFLEEFAVTSPNQACMAQARESTPEQVLQLLPQIYQEPDPVFDRERWLLEAQACMAVARKALDDGRPGYARQLLERAVCAGAKTPYFTAPLARECDLLAFEAGIRPQELLPKLPADDRELCLRAQVALDEGRSTDCIRLLDAAQLRDGRWHFLRGQAYLAQKDLAEAAASFLSAQDYAPQRVYGYLEYCYREMEDYKQAYFFACKQR